MVFGLHSFLKKHGKWIELVFVYGKIKFFEKLVGGTCKVYARVGSFWKPEAITFAGNSVFVG